MPFALEVKKEVSASFSGSQYMMLGLPFGSTIIHKPEELLYNTLFEQLSLKGIRISPSQQTGVPRGILNLRDLSCSAYDFLLIRRNVCRIDALFELHGQSGQIIERFRFRESESEFARYGFALQLSVLLDRLLEKAAEQLSESLVSPLQVAEGRWGKTP